MEGFWQRPGKKALKDFVFGMLAAVNGIVKI
jgi:argininosuccinate synthase